MAKQSFAGAFNGLFSEVRVQLAPLPELEAFYGSPTFSRWSILEPLSSATGYLTLLGPLEGVPNLQVPTHMGGPCKACLRVLKSTQHGMTPPS